MSTITVTAPFLLYDADEIRRALEIYLAPGQVTELRVLDCKLHGAWKRGTYSGYFDSEHIDDLIGAISQIESATGIYFVPNLVNPALHARAFNHARIVRDKEPVTSDNDVLRRRWLLIDVDPVRPSGISSTLEEKEAARNVVFDVDHELWRRGLPPGILADSGNGWHLTIPIDLPADDGGMVERLLKSLAAQFDTDKAKVDTAVHNPSRIWKLPGALAGKGDNVPALGREWRIARIVQVCKEVPDNA